jgi:hypothetical protein
MPHQYTLGSEKEKQSKFSLGVVKDEEELLRLLYTPEHVRDGLVIESAISLDDLKCRGLSLDRFDFAKKEIIQERINSQMLKKPEDREEASLAKFTCQDIRSVNNKENLQQNLVIDDATEENIAHSSIFNNNEIGKGRATLRKSRSLLIEYLQDRYSLDSLIFSE